MINLLPPQYKEELIAEETNRLIMILGVLLSLSLFSLVLVLLAINIYLSGEVQSQQIFLESEKEKSEVKEIQDLENQVAIFNKKLSILDDFYNQKISLTEIFNKTIKEIPREIYLHNFSYSKDASQIILSGFAPSRDILFQFKRNLEADFQDVYFPPNNWIQSTNIEFSGVSFKISQ